jgi:hypothetical protein
MSHAITDDLPASLAEWADELSTAPDGNGNIVLGYN